jgi:hypothetical protein
VVYAVLQSIARARAIAYFKQFLKCNSVEEVINLAKKERHFETAVLMFYKWL